MEKVTKMFVEKLYPGIIVSDICISEIQERDPLKVENNGNMIGFRFFDKETIIDKGQKFESNNTNYSNWFFFGVRLSYEDVKFLQESNSKYSKILSYMKNNDFKYVCYTQTGSFLPMEDDDMTYEEYVSNKRVLKRD